MKSKWKQLLILVGACGISYFIGRHVSTLLTRQPNTGIIHHRTRTPIDGEKHWKLEGAEENERVNLFGKTKRALQSEEALLKAKISDKLNGRRRKQSEGPKDPEEDLLKRDNKNMENDENEDNKKPEEKENESFETQEMKEERIKKQIRASTRKPEKPKMELDYQGQPIRHKLKFSEDRQPVAAELESRDMRPSGEQSAKKLKLESGEGNVDDLIPKKNKKKKEGQKNYEIDNDDMSEKLREKREDELTDNDTKNRKFQKDFEHEKEEGKLVNLVGGNTRCPKKFGKVGIFVVYTNASQYTHATDVLWCYAISRGYEFFLVQPYEDALSTEECSSIREVMFRKHCAAAAYLHKVDWLFVSDADTAVINSDKCIEDFLDPRADLIFYERFFSGEVMSGNYLAQNTPAAKKAMKQWAKIEAEQPPQPYFFSSDNGAIHLLFLRILFPNLIDEHQKCFDFVKTSVWPNWEPGYGAFVRCSKQMILAFNSKKPGHRGVRIKMFPRAQGWVRDISDTWYNRWSGDFMAHSIKSTDPFSPKMLERLELLWREAIPKECLYPNWTPKIITGDLVSKEEMRSSLGYVAREFEKGKLKPLFANMKFDDCWPNCQLILEP